MKASSVGSSGREGVRRLFEAAEIEDEDAVWLGAVLCRCARRKIGRRCALMFNLQNTHFSGMDKRRLIR